MWEFNKMAGAVLFLALPLVALNVVGDIIYPEPTPLVGHYQSKQAKPNLTQKPSQKSNTKIIASCKPCHTFDSKGKNKMGPNLWQIVGRKKASISNFNYSNALKKLGGKWDKTSLDAFIENPAGYAKGTKMAFAGIKDSAKRAELIDWLATMNKSEAPPPK